MPRPHLEYGADGDIPVLQVRVCHLRIADNLFYQVKIDSVWVKIEP